VIVRSVVVDASLALKWVIAEPFSAEAAVLLGEWLRDRVERLAPTLLAYEVTNALYRASRTEADPEQWLASAVGGVLSAVTFCEHSDVLLVRGGAIARQLGRPAAYDTQYVSLAEAEGCEVWTADERFWNAAKGGFPRVRWIGERAGIIR
jgi:predicted nucleic acid-binding protein